MWRDGQEGGATLLGVRREDYSASAFWVDTVDLSFDLDPAKTRVLNKMQVRRNSAQTEQPLRLDGDGLTLARVLVNGEGTSFKIESNQLVLENLPSGDAPFSLEILTTCEPEKNTKLMGLFVSQDTFFTQCEPDGFRRITYFLDRPDVMASYTVTLRADKTKYPVLLSNGNLVEHGDLEDGRHFAKWIDPHKKPCYLFALVAGYLVAREQRITSRLGKNHLLQVYVRPCDLDKTEHALHSLMAAVAWDEERFGLSLDLERFMIVATSDFNMGAMENKGLNIFNTKFVLANQTTATDVDFANVESVVGHEYFHNWTGNRVTCQDWFQLSLKEGLTVFRDQEFSMDMAGAASARAVKRIEDVGTLRTIQFSEDAGPMAHPVRPDSYVEINNFYTATVYEKGAEVVRMMHTLVGALGFKKGMALYFERHDGHAVTCDDFAQAMSDANPQSALAQHLAQFKRWYAQAGTPRLKARGVYDATARQYQLSLSQTCPATPGQPHKEPFVIPVSMGLLGQDGRALPTQLEGEAVAQSGNRLLTLTKSSETFTFIGIDEAPVPSLLRGFSAPVILESADSDAALLTLLQSDSDSFNQWEAGQRLALRCAIKAIHALASGTVDAHAVQPLDAAFIGAMRSVLCDSTLDAAFKSLVLTMPAETYIAEYVEEVNPQHIHIVREAMKVQLALGLYQEWQQTYRSSMVLGAYHPDAMAAGRRALHGMAMEFLCLASCRDGSAQQTWPGKIYQRFKDAGNMTDRINALNALVRCGHELAVPALARFHDMLKTEDLVLDKWFYLQSTAPDREGNILPAVRRLMLHPDFHIKNPNRARSVIFGYCNGNPAAFHREDAAGYVFWSDRVLELDSMNPQVAARLARALDRWKKLADPFRSAAREAITRVLAKPDLSSDVREVVTRALAD